MLGCLKSKISFLKAPQHPLSKDTIILCLFLRNEIKCSSQLYKTDKGAVPIVEGSWGETSCQQSLMALEPLPPPHGTSKLLQHSGLETQFSEMQIMGVYGHIQEYTSSPKWSLHNWLARLRNVLASSVKYRDWCPSDTPSWQSSCQHAPGLLPTPDEMWDFGVCF